VGKDKFLARGVRQQNVDLVYRMWHCGVDVAYLRLSDWTCL